MNSRILASLLAIAVVASICVTAAGEARVSSCGISIDWLPLLAQPGKRCAVCGTPAPFSRFTAVTAALAVPPRAGERRTGCTARALREAGDFVAAAPGSRRLRVPWRLRRHRGLLGALLTFLPRSELLASDRLVCEPLLRETARRGDLRLRRRLPERAIAQSTRPAQRKGGVVALAVRHALHCAMRLVILLQRLDITRTTAFG